MNITFEGNQQHLCSGASQLQPRGGQGAMTTSRTRTPGSTRGRRDDTQSVEDVGDKGKRRTTGSDSFPLPSSPKRAKTGDTDRSGSSDIRSDVAGSSSQRPRPGLGSSASSEGQVATTTASATATATATRGDVGGKGKRRAIGSDSSSFSSLPKRAKSRFGSDGVGSNNNRSNVGGSSPSQGAPTPSRSTLSLERQVTPITSTSPSTTAITRTRPLALTRAEDASRKGELSANDQHGGIVSFTCIKCEKARVAWICGGQSVPTKCKYEFWQSWGTTGPNATTRMDFERCCDPPVCSELSTLCGGTSSFQDCITFDRKSTTYMFNPFYLLVRAMFYDACNLTKIRTQDVCAGLDVPLPIRSPQVPVLRVWERCFEEVKFQEDGQKPLPAKSHFKRLYSTEIRRQNFELVGDRESTEQLHCMARLIRENSGDVQPLEGDLAPALAPVGQTWQILEIMVNTLGHAAAFKELRQAAKRMFEDSRKVYFTGDFGAGKSTIIDTLLAMSTPDVYSDRVEGETYPTTILDDDHLGPNWKPELNTGRRYLLPETNDSGSTTTCPMVFEYSETFALTVTLRSMASWVDYVSRLIALFVNGGGNDSDGVKCDPGQCLSSILGEPDKTILEDWLDDEDWACYFQGTRSFELKDSHKLPKCFEILSPTLSTNEVQTRLEKLLGDGMPAFSVSLMNGDSPAWTMTIQTNGKRLADDKRLVQEAMRSIFPSELDEELQSFRTAIDSVTVKVPSILLRTGVVLVDSPGCNDKDPLKIQALYDMIRYSSEDRSIVFVAKDMSDSLSELMSYTHVLEQKPPTWTVVVNPELSRRRSLEESLRVDKGNVEFVKKLARYYRTVVNNSKEAGVQEAFLDLASERVVWSRSSLFGHLVSCGKNFNDVQDGRIGYSRVLSLLDKLSSDGFQRNTSHFLDVATRFMTERWGGRSPGTPVEAVVKATVTVEQICEAWDEQVDNLKREIAGWKRSFDGIFKTTSIAAKLAELTDSTPWDVPANVSSDYILVGSTKRASSSPSSKCRTPRKCTNPRVTLRDEFVPERELKTALASTMDTLKQELQAMCRKWTEKALKNSFKHFGVEVDPAKLSDHAWRVCPRVKNITTHAYSKALGETRDKIVKDFQHWCNSTRDKYSERQKVAAFLEEERKKKYRKQFSDMVKEKLKATFIYQCDKIKGDLKDLHQAVCAELKPSEECQDTEQEICEMLKHMIAQVRALDRSTQGDSGSDLAAAVRRFGALRHAVRTLSVEHRNLVGVGELECTRAPPGCTEGMLPPLFTQSEQEGIVNLRDTTLLSTLGPLATEEYGASQYLSRFIESSLGIRSRSLDLVLPQLLEAFNEDRVSSETVQRCEWGDLSRPKTLNVLVFLSVFYNRHIVLDLGEQGKFLVVKRHGNGMTESLSKCDIVTLHSVAPPIPPSPAPAPAAAPAAAPQRQPPAPKTKKLQQKSAAKLPPTSKNWYSTFALCWWTRNVEGNYETSLYPDRTRVRTNVKELAARPILDRRSKTPCPMKGRAFQDLAKTSLQFTDIECQYAQVKDEDAYCAASHLLTVLDGVSEAQHSRDFARRLLANTFRHSFRISLDKDRPVNESLEVIGKAYKETVPSKETVPYGETVPQLTRDSGAACGVVAIPRDGRFLHIWACGDCRLFVLRVCDDRWNVAYATKRHYFPRRPTRARKQQGPTPPVPTQLGHYNRRPDRASHQLLRPDAPELSTNHEFAACDGDLVIVASDGIWDNMPLNEDDVELRRLLCNIASQEHGDTKRIREAVWKYVHTKKHFVKQDDRTLVIAKLRLAKHTGLYREITRTNTQ